MKNNGGSSDKLKALHDRIGSVIMGKDREITLALVTLLSRGHLLIEDIPGVGKTTLAYMLARSIDCSFQRIQFTSDLMPSDIIGVSIYNPEAREFEFKAGPLFAHIVLADEINRTTPKTQSALLEAMNERRVSVDKKTYVLPEPFMVIATQNPLEYRGTYPLPESQLDRFTMHLKLGYPPEEAERKALMDPREFGDLEALGPVVSAADILKMQHEVDGVHVDKDVLGYLMEVVGATRTSEKLLLGVSTRGAQFLLKAARARAYFEGRGYLVPDDVRELAPSVLGHRVLPRRQATIDEADRIISELIGAIPVPA